MGSSRWRRVVSFTLRPFYSRGINFLYPLGSKVHWPRSSDSGSIFNTSRKSEHWKSSSLTSHRSPSTPFLDRFKIARNWLRQNSFRLTFLLSPGLCYCIFRHIWCGSVQEIWSCCFSSLLLYLWYYSSELVTNVFTSSVACVCVLFILCHLSIFLSHGVTLVWS